MKTQKIKMLLSGLFMLSLCLVADAQEKSAARTKHPLWRVSSKENSVYLLGSVHLLKEGNYPLADVIEAAFKESEIAVFEVDLGDMVKPEKQMVILQKAFLPPDQTLQGQLSKETYERLKEAAAAMQLNVAMLARFRPWYVAVAVSMEKLRRLGFLPENGVDRHYYNKAVKAGKKVVGLETIEDQLDMFAKLTEKNQEEFLGQVLDDMDMVEDQLSEIVKAWSTGDAKGIEKTLLKSFKDHPDIYEVVLTSRNKKWLVKVEQFLKGKKKHFVVVGTAHVAGKDSLVELLEKKGYKVEQL